MDAPVILRESDHGLKRGQIAHEALRVLTRLDEAGYKGYLCGGGVRDLLLGRTPKDFDIATDARPEEVKRLFRNCRIIGRRFKLAHVFFRDVIIETATFRALRIASQLDFEIERGAREAIIQQCGELRNSSRDRLHEEMLKILNCGCALKVFERAWQKGLFQTIYPAFSNWLQGPDKHAAMAWVKKALRQFDVWKQNGLKPMPALQHALLFGPYMEGMAGAFAAEGLPEFEATLQAVNTVLRDKANLTQIPKAVVFDVERIMGIQVQMKKSSGQSKYASRLRHRNGFDEALIYLKFAGGIDASRKELADLWMAPAPEPPAPHSAPHPAPHPRRHESAPRIHERTHEPRRHEPPQAPSRPPESAPQE